MGEVAMTSPVVANMAVAFPEEKITVLTEGRLAQLFEDIPKIKIEGIDLKKDRGFFKTLKIYRRLKEEGFDKVIDLQDSARSKILVWLFRRDKVPCHVIKNGKKEKKRLVSGENRIQMQTTMERYREVFQRAGLPFSLPQKPEHRTIPAPYAITVITGEKRGKWYGVAPFAKYKGKSYPTEKAAKLIKMLAKEENDRVFVFCGADEKKTADKITADIPNAVTVFGKVSLKGEVELMSNLDVMVSTDSAAMHLASLAGTRVVSIWGATHRYAGFLGWGQDEDDAVELDLECRPCSVYGNRPCHNGDYPCIKEIEPEMIYERVMNKPSL